MISRSSSLEVASAYTKAFAYESSNPRYPEKVYRDKIYDFLYENEYEPYFCNLAKKPPSVRAFKEFFLKIHTGESLVSATENWDWERRQKLGQRLLKELAEDYLNWFEKNNDGGFFMEQHEQYYKRILLRLELDGYIFRDEVLLQQQSDILNVEEEKGILQSLYKKTELNRQKEAFEFLLLSEQHFLASRWSDCIANSRKFFELTLQEGALKIEKSKGMDFDENKFLRPVEVRSYFEKEGILEKKEKEALDKMYGLLSETGAHPYMAESDQARLLRQLSLTISQFVLLRLEKKIKG